MYCLRRMYTGINWNSALKKIGVELYTRPAMPHCMIPAAYKGAAMGDVTQVLVLANPISNQNAARHAIDPRRIRPACVTTISAK